jgi:hypothetical protein
VRLGCTLSARLSGSFPRNFLHRLRRGLKCATKRRIESTFRLRFGIVFCLAFVHAVTCASAEPYFTTRVEEKPRVLFSVLEKKNGELIIPVRSAERYGHTYSSAIPILEQRFSIHPSLKSKDYTTIKHTTNLVDGTQVSSVALTDAIKLRTGFSIVYVKRVQDLSPEKYLLSEADANSSTLIKLPPIKPPTEMLFYGLLVGPIEIEFKAKDPDVLVIQHCFKPISHRRTCYLVPKVAVSSHV